MIRIQSRLLPALLVVGISFAAQAKQPAKAPGDQPAIISESETAHYWQPASPIAEPALATPAPDKSEDVCVSLGYVVKPDGTTSDYALLRSWSSKHAKGIPSSDAYSIYSRTAVAATMQRKYTAAPSMGDKPVAIFTATTFVFPAQPDGDRASLRARCAIDNLPDFIRRAQEDSYRRRGNLNKGEIDRRPSPEVIRTPSPMGAGAKP